MQYIHLLKTQLVEKDETYICIANEVTTIFRKLQGVSFLQGPWFLPSCASVAASWWVVVWLSPPPLGLPVGPRQPLRPLVA